MDGCAECVVDQGLAVERGHSAEIGGNDESRDAFVVFQPNTGRADGPFQSGFYFFFEIHSVTPRSMTI